MCNPAASQDSAQRHRSGLAQSSSPDIAAVILAAGKAERLGGEPKALLHIDGVPLIRRLLGALYGAGVAQAVVVTGHRADEVDRALAGMPATRAHNPEYAHGQMTSLRVGLAALPHNIDGILVALGDQPLLTSADLKALLAAFARRGDADVLRPRSQGRFGHPVVMTARLREAVVEGPLDAGARYWMARNPDRVAHYDTDCEHYFVDIDTPEDLEGLRLRHGLDIRLPREIAHG